MKMLTGVAIALLASSAAFAQPMGGHRGGDRPKMMDMMGGHCMMMQRTEGALAFLKTELKIEPSQERAWDAFATAFRDAASDEHGDGQDEHGDDRKGHREHGKTQSFLENADHHLEMMEAHHESFKKTYEAAKSLYATLGADQRKTADELLMHYVMPHHGGMM